LTGGLQAAGAKPAIVIVAFLVMAAVFVLTVVS
jgi:hypothetical protein